MSKKTTLIGAVSIVAMMSLCAVQAEAKSPGGLMGGGDKSKNKEPIEVTSDTLEVFQQENRAVFSGHVVAIQGDTRLKADTMNIFYNPPKDQGGVPGEKKADKPKKPAEAAPDNAEGKKEGKAGASDSVKKIDVQGNVFLATPEETASGDNGTYDVEHNMIFLNNNVVLTRGQNVLKGNHLTYNFATGKSVLTSEAGDKAAGTGEAASGTKQRVRALFVPENSQNQPKTNQGVTKEKK